MYRVIAAGSCPAIPFHSRVVVTGDLPAVCCVMCDATDCKQKAVHGSAALYECCARVVAKQQCCCSPSARRMALVLTNMCSTNNNNGTVAQHKSMVLQIYYSSCSLVQHR